jgi:hypothetical protein
MPGLEKTLLPEERSKLPESGIKHAFADLPTNDCLYSCVFVEFFSKLERHFREFCLVTFRLLGRFSGEPMLQTDEHRQNQPPYLENETKFKVE